jgi:hypothetical protein
VTGPFTYEAVPAINVRLIDDPDSIGPIADPMPADLSIARSGVTSRRGEVILLDDSGGDQRSTGASPVVTSRLSGIVSGDDLRTTGTSPVEAKHVKPGHDGARPH